MVKKRLYKKWIKRYLMSLVKNLPTTNGCGWVNPITKDEDDRIEGYNYTLINGYIKAPVLYMTDKCYHGHILTHIKRTAAMIQGILDTHQIVYLRQAPEVQYSFRDNGHKHTPCIRMRLIVEEEGVHLDRTV